MTAQVRQIAAMSLLMKIVLGVLAVYAALALAAYLGQRRLMYFPDRARTLPQQVGLANVEERVLNMPDGARVVAWYGKAQPGAPTLLYFHGNGGSLAARAARFERFMAQGGPPSERANVADARLAYGALLLEGVAPQSVILYGESLGTGVAARIATERQAAGLILESPYTSIVDVAAGAYPFLPVRLFLGDRYETDKVIAQGACAGADPARRAGSGHSRGHGTRFGAASQ